MPELPEVETTRRGIAPHLEGKRIVRVEVRAGKLRRPLGKELAQAAGQMVQRVERRAKYLLLRCDGGTLLLHLGMSGSLRIVPASQPPGKHDHLDLALDDGMALRFCDPRRFGLAAWTAEDPLTHPLLAGCGPEPLDNEFGGDHLYRMSRDRTVAVKQLLMDGRTVAGVGNIYANEALFRAGIRPETPAGRLSRERCQRLAVAVKEVLAEAIELGGTTLRDFADGEGKPGYFRIRLAVYDRAGDPCPRCATPITATRQGGRSTYCCRKCQR